MRWRSIVQRVAAAILMVTVGSLIYGKLLSPIAHARSQSMLESRLASDLLNGVAPVSYPIEAGTPLGVVEVEDRGLRALFVEGTSSQELSVAAGHVTGSALPGQPGVSALMGRSSRAGAEFAHLDRVRVGDDVAVTTGQGEHTYTVVDITTRDPRDMSAFVGERHMLIMTTLVSEDSRLVVRAELTSAVQAAGDYPDHITQSSELGTVGDDNGAGMLVLWLGLAAAVAALWPLLSSQVGRRVAWMITSPVAVWIAVEMWSTIELLGPSSL